MGSLRAIGTALFSMVALSAPVFAADAAAPAAKDWPQWRGPAGTGGSPTAEPPVKFGETQNLKWKVKLPGRGSSTPIVVGDKIFIQTAIPTGKQGQPPAPAAAPAEPAPPPQPQPGPGGGRPGGRRPGGGRGFGSGPPPTEVHQFALLCIDRNTGKTLWQKVAREEVPHEGHHKDHSFASYSPASDGSVIIAFFGSRGVHCYDLDGNLKWQKDLGRMRTRNNFGEGSSPALHGDTVVINWDHEGSDFIVALNKTTGDELWRQPRDEITTWTTPLIVEHKGNAQAVVAATNKVRSYDLKTGKVLWEVGGMTDNVIPTPVAGDGMVFITSGFKGAALLAVKLDAASGDLGAKADAIAWRHNKSTPYVPSPLLYDGRLYFLAGNAASLSVFEARTGKPLIESKRVEDLQNVYASPVGAAGRVYLASREGGVAVIKAADTYEVLSTTTLNEGIDASPAVAGKDLIIRGKENLYCFAEK